MLLGLFWHYYYKLVNIFYTVLPQLKFKLDTLAHTSDRTWIDPFKGDMDKIHIYYFILLVVD